MHLLIFKLTFLVTPDIDECSADSSPCDGNADCTNSDGSYSCTCKQGFTGDGTTCDGRSKVCFLSCVYVKPALDRVKIVKSPVIGARVCFVVCLLFSFDLSFHFRVLFLLLQLIHSTNFTAVIHFGH